MSMERLWRTGIVTLVLAFVTGCPTTSKPPPPGEFPFTVEPTLVDTVWRVRPPLEGTHRLEYGLGDVDTHTEPFASSERLLALHTGDWWVRVRTTDADGVEHVSDTAEVSVPELPEGLAPFEVLTQGASAEMSERWLLVNQYDPETERSWASLVDGDGRHRWYLEAPQGELKLHRVRLDPGGDGVWWSGYHWWREEDRGTIVHTAWDGTERTRFAAEQEHHDFVVHDDGSVAWLSWVFDDTPMPGAEGPTAADAVRVRSPQGETSIAFSMLKDYPRDPSVPCGHALRQKYLPGYNEWSHSNSLVWEPVEDVWWVLARYLDQILIIDRATGALKRRIGGAGSDVLFDGLAFDHGHFSEAWEDGALVFDNRNHDEARGSRVVEYAFADGVAEEVWSYAQPDGLRVGFLGDARRLPGGNRLIVWSNMGRVEEVTPQGQVVWGIETLDTVGRGWTEPAQALRTGG